MVVFLTLRIPWSSEIQNSLPLFIHPARGVDMALIYQLHLIIYRLSIVFYLWKRFIEHQLLRVLTHILSSVC